MTPQTQLTADLNITGYQLLRLLGRGGMGDVWLASDLRADRQVALKFIKPTFLDDPALRTRFLNEARTLGRLEHDRIVTLYTVVEERPWLALVLRFIDGNSLADRIDTHGALPIDFVLSSARDILPALGFAHDHGVIHRDMKPQNILIDRRDRSFLTDFGIAVADFAERGTVTGFAVGTPHYMSPEQIQTPREVTVQNGGHRSDIYSYGVVLYEMLTGRVPFCCDSGAEEIYKVQHAHCVEPPPPLREVNPNVPAALESVVMRCLEKNPDDRPQSCMELLHQFEAAANGSAVAPARPIAVRAATVVEKSPSIPARPEVKRVTPAVSPKRGMPKAAWLGLGGVLIAAGISYAVYTSSSGASGTSKGGDSKAAEIHDTQPGPTGSTSAPTGSMTSPITKPSAGSTQIGANKPPMGVVNPPSGRGAGLPAAPAASAPSNALAAERDYTQAADLSSKGRVCDAKDPIDQAVRLDPGNAKYSILQRSLARDCAAITKNAQDAQTKFDEANLQFEQGNYCEGKSAIDQAVKLDPTNTKYKELQQRLAKGCRLP